MRVSRYSLPVSLVIDPDTPASALTRTGFDSYTYDLVFSDEFNEAGRTFLPGDDLYWEAANLTTSDKEYYDPAQVTTKQGGYLSIVMDSDSENELGWRSGMLQSWNQFCFTRGYIEVAISLPGTVEAQGYVGGSLFLSCVLLLMDGDLRSGRAHGRWGISQGLGMLLRLMAYGPTRAYFTLVSCTHVHG